MNKEYVLFYDTNALLNLGENAFKENFVISQKTLEEIENIKVSASKDPDVKWKARNISRLLDKNYGEEVGFGIWDNPDGLDVLLTNLGFKNLRANLNEEQANVHFNWDEAAKLRDYLDKVITEHNKE